MYRKIIHSHRIKVNEISLTNALILGLNILLVPEF
jgi:hypothetical protein